MWVVLGGRHLGTTHKIRYVTLISIIDTVHLTKYRPFISNQGPTQVFAIQVVNNSEANEVLSLLPLLQKRDENEPKCELAQWLATSEDVEGILRDINHFHIHSRSTSY
jgi:hypothetical protein